MRVASLPIARAVDLLLQIISRRHEQASTIITTNLSFEDWSNVFPGAACLVPLVDRFTENLVVFDIHGDSYRQRSKPTTSPTKPGKKPPKPDERTPKHTRPRAPNGGAGPFAFHLTRLPQIRAHTRGPNFCGS